MATKSKAAPQAAQPRSEIEAYLIEHGIEYNPDIIDPPSIDKYNAAAPNPQAFAGPGYRPDLFVYYRTTREGRIGSLKARGWMIVPDSQVYVESCRSDNEIVLCRPLELDQKLRAQKAAEHNARRTGRTRKSTPIGGRHLMESTVDSRIGIK